MAVLQFRKKPVVIEALKFEYTVDGLEALIAFCGDELLKFGTERHMGAKAWAWIGTLEDGDNGEAKHVATEGDWIIKGVQGEFYACKPDIFEMTYERVEE